jgi:transposase
MADNRFSLSSALTSFSTFCQTGRWPDHPLRRANGHETRNERMVALGRKNYLFMGSIGGWKAATIAYTLIETAKMNNVDPEAWLT